MPMIPHDVLQDQVRHVWRGLEGRRLRPGQALLENKKAKAFLSDVLMRQVKRELEVNLREVIANLLDEVEVVLRLNKLAGIVLDEFASKQIPPTFSYKGDVFSLDVKTLMLAMEILLIENGYSVEKMDGLGPASVIRVSLVAEEEEEDGVEDEVDPQEEPQAGPSPLSIEDSSDSDEVDDLDEEGSEEDGQEEDIFDELEEEASAPA